MKTNIKVTILSTEATDILLTEDLKLMNSQKGGPAMFIKDVFNNQQISYISNLITGLTVEILITNAGEFGRVKNIPKALNIAYDELETPYLLISSVSSEINLRGLENFKGKTFIDIQGFVRDGSDFGKKMLWSPSNRIFNSIYCLKGTAEEISYLPEDYIQKQKYKILIITKGEKGVDAYIKGLQYSIQPKKTVRSYDTIGAGDTFFAYFVATLVKTDDVVNSLNQAVSQTSIFLASKSHHNQSL